jgi:hypothetical protein
MKRWLRLAGLVPVIALGLASRLRPIGWVWYDHHLGDVLYAVAAYLALGFLMPRLPRHWLAGLAMGACWGVEGLKATGLSAELERMLPGCRWVLGTTFAGSNLVWYAVGVVGVILVEIAVGRIIMISQKSAVR